MVKIVPIPPPPPLPNLIVKINYHTGIPKIKASDLKECNT